MADLLLPGVGLVSGGEVVLLPGGALLDPSGNAITANAATLSFASGTASINQAVVLSAAAATLHFSGGSASIGPSTVETYLVPGVGIVAGSGSLLLSAALVQMDEPGAGAETLVATAAAWTFTGVQASASQSHLADLTWFELYLSSVVSVTAPTWLWSAGTASLGQRQQVTGTAAAWTWAGVAATVSQPVLLSGNAATLTFTGGTGSFSQAYSVEGVAPEWSLAGIGASVGQQQHVTGAAGVLTFTAVAATVTQEQRIVTATAGSWTITAGTATVVQASLVEAQAPTWAWTAGTFEAAQRQYLTASAASLAFSVGQGEISEVRNFAPGELVLAWSDERAAIVQDQIVTITPAAWAFTGGVATYGLGFSSLLRFWCSAIRLPPTVGYPSLLRLCGGSAIGTTGLGGRLIRTRRRRHIYDEDSELGRLATLLGQHPPERDARGLLLAVKQGLAREFESGAPPAVDYAADGALILSLADQQIRLTGALKRHVEILADDQEVMDLLDLIA